jgi:hypothetical protein
MKIALRFAVFTLVVAAAVVGNSMPKSPSTTPVHQASVPGPLPTCNPFTQKCPTIR